MTYEHADPSIVMRHQHALFSADEWTGTLSCAARCRTIARLLRSVLPGPRDVLDDLAAIGDRRGVAPAYDRGPTPSYGRKDPAAAGAREPGWQDNVSGDVMRRVLR